MKLKKIYDLIIEEGINSDPRDKESVKDQLKARRRFYESLPLKEKEFFDKEKLTNPYDDTRLIHGDPDTDVKGLLVGIDIDTSELLLMDRLNTAKDRRKKIDAALSHHPQGAAYAHFYDVMEMQADIYHAAGIPINITETMVEERKNEVKRRVHAANHQRAADAARLLGIPFLCAHTPADNHASSYLERLIEKGRPQTLQEILHMLLGITEYQYAAKGNNPPCLLFGKPSNRCGKIFVDMTGGTEGPKDIVDNLLQAGVGTILGMHFSEEHYKKLQGKNIHCVVAGHIASDNLGINLLLDKLEKRQKLNILACSGFKRISR